MGTDIHLFVEKKLDNGVWQAIRGKNPHLDSWNKSLKEAKENNNESRIEGIKDILSDMPKERYEGWLYWRRNYTLFSILANVRNYGEEKIEYIDTARGIPEDVSQVVSDRYSDAVSYCHHASYINLQEIIDFDWYKELTLGGWVTEEVYKDWIQSNDEPNYPERWAGGVGGGNVEQVSNKIMNHIINDNYDAYNEDKSYYTKISWKVQYIDEIPKFQDIALNVGSNDRVRLVFWFDS